MKKGRTVRTGSGGSQKEGCQDTSGKITKRRQGIANAGSRVDSRTLKDY